MGNKRMKDEMKKQLERNNKRVREERWNKETRNKDCNN